MALTPQQAANALRGIESKLEQIADGLRADVRNTFGTRATSDYMQLAAIGPRTQKSGPLRRQNGRLARSIGAGRDADFGDESIMKSEAKGSSIKFTWGSRVPYARVHEEGFQGQVPVSAHSRTITQAFGQQIPTQTVQVSAHSRQMNIPARPYLEPAVKDEAVNVGRMIAGRIVDIVQDALDE